jgi:hypothetical protein
VPSGSASVPSGLSSVSLVDASGTLYLVSGGQRYGVTDPGILRSYGLSFADASPATPGELASPVAGNVPPAAGSLVRTSSDPTVYLVSSDGSRHAFTSAQVFAGLGFRFSSVLTVTAPELSAQPVGSPIASGAAAHPAGADVSSRGTVYWIGPDSQRHPYPSLAAYNSWHLSGDFSTVVPANPADLSLPVGTAVGERTKE